MGNFRDRSGGGRRGGGFGGERRSFGGGRDSGGRSNFGSDRGSERSQMFAAICDNCGRECQVPFKPTNGKPVFCDDCFRNRDNDRGDFQKPDRRFEDRRFDNRERSFDRSDDRPHRDQKDANIKLMEQMSMLNHKLDRILAALGSKEIRKSSVKADKIEKDTKSSIMEEASGIADLAVEAKPKKSKKVAEKKSKVKKK